jgi:hypothetical protein
MAYDERLATRIRKVLARRKGFSEKRMFGGVAFFLGGNMCCCGAGFGKLRHSPLPCRQNRFVTESRLGN